MQAEDTMYGAIVRGDVSKVRELVSSDPAILKHLVVHKSWLHLAAQKGNIDVMRVMVDAGLPVDQLTEDGGSTPLNIAAGQGHHDACEWLLDHGADVNYGYGVKATPIFSAIFGGQLPVVALLIRRGARLDAAFGEPRQTVLTYAQRHGTNEISTFLAEHRGSPQS